MTKHAIYDLQWKKTESMKKVIISDYLEETLRTDFFP